MDHNNPYMMLIWLGLPFFIFFLVGMYWPSKQNSSVKDSIHIPEHIIERPKKYITRDVGKVVATIHTKDFGKFDKEFVGSLEFKINWFGSIHRNKPKYWLITSYADHIFGVWEKGIYQEGLVSLPNTNIHIPVSNIEKIEYVESEYKLTIEDKNEY